MWSTLWSNYLCDWKVWITLPCIAMTQQMMDWHQKERHLKEINLHRLLSQGWRKTTSHSHIKWEKVGKHTSYRTVTFPDLVIPNLSTRCSQSFPLLANHPAQVIPATPVPCSLIHGQCKYRLQSSTLLPWHSFPSIPARLYCVHA